MMETGGGCFALPKIRALGLLGRGVGQLGKV